MLIFFKIIDFSSLYLFEYIYQIYSKRIKIIAERGKVIRIEIIKT